MSSKDADTKGDDVGAQSTTAAAAADNGSDQDAQQAKAARLIQSNYRGYRTRRELAGQGMDAGTRWAEAFKHMKLDDAREQQLGKKAGGAGKSDAQNRWKRGGVLVGQIAGSPGTGAGGKEEMKGSDPAAAGPIGTDGPVEGGPTLHGDDEEAQGDDSNQEGAAAGGAPQKGTSHGMIGDVPGANDGEKIDNVKRIAKPNQHGLRMIEWWTRGAAAQDLSKTMEAAQWLEMVDKKHRYGSNLKPYHAAWSDADTKDNFFVWLDEGGGKELDLDSCPRERLESERVTYLTAEQRLNYVVDIKDGKLYWRRNGKPVDTTKGKHKDLGDGQGIVELGPEEQEEERRIQREKLEERRQAGSGGSVSSFSSESSFESAISDDEKREAKHYGAELSKRRRRLGMLTSSGWMDALLRKTVQGNTWIYVLNSRRELYVGIKQTGKFQHSSFLSGGRVLSAGLLKAKDGTLTSLSPLSGHYRAGTAHFRHFVQLLQQENVDLEHVTLSKSLLLLRGMEAYGSMTKKKKKDKKGKDGDKDGSAEITLTKLVKEKSTRDAAKDKIRSGNGKKESPEDQSEQQNGGPEGEKLEAAPPLPRQTSSQSSTSNGPSPSESKDKAKTLTERIRGDKAASSSGDGVDAGSSQEKKSGFSKALDKILHPSKKTEKGSDA